MYNINIVDIGMSQAIQIPIQNRLDEPTSIDSRYDGRIKGGRVEEAVSFGQWMKQRRKEMDLTQEELAQKVGCAAINIRKIEANERRPSKPMAALLAKHLNIPAEEYEKFERFARGIPSTDLSFSHSPAPQNQPLISWPASRIPSIRTALVGREAEVIAVCQQLQKGLPRLVTLTGAPGVGKTRLAVAVSERMRASFPDGLAFIELARLGKANQVGWAIAQGLGLMGSGGKGYPEQIAALLTGKRFLLVLDNFEHVIAAARLVSDLLDACPQLSILTTSRERLRLYGEYEYPVSPLTLPERNNLTSFENGQLVDVVASSPAVQLFLQHAQTVQPGYRLTRENARQIAEICIRLDGLPLAIELASAQVRLYSPKTILTQLSQRLQFLARGTRDLVLRQHTLRDAIDWSYQLLSTAEQTLFAQLAVFQGSFSAEAAMKICAANETGSLLLALVEKSLVEMVSQSEEESPRFLLLETIREYAQSHLRDCGEEKQLRFQHADYFFHLVSQADQQLRGPLSAAWLDRLDIEYSNIRSALAWALGEGDWQAGCQTVAALFFYWYRRSPFQEARFWLETALEQVHVPQCPAVYARLLESAGALGYFEGERMQSPQRLDQSITLCKDQNNLHGLASACFWRSLVSNRSEESFDYLQESIRLFRQLSDVWWLAMALWLYGAYTVSRGGDVPAISCLQESETLFRRIGDPYGISLALQSLGRADILAGNLSSARQRYGESLQLKQSVRDRWSLSQVLADIGDLELLEAATSKEFRQAEVWFEQSLAIRREQGMGHVEYPYRLHRLGMTAFAQGNTRKALDLYRECLTLCIKHDTGSNWIASFLVGPAQLALNYGEFDRAAKLLGAIRSLDPLFPMPIDQVGEKWFKQIQVALLGCMKETEFIETCAKGQRMNIQAAISLAYADLSELS
jgi:predicted ATPase/transcriptional regulator with XRE-family HTH domain